MFFGVFPRDPQPPAWEEESTIQDFLLLHRGWAQTRGLAVGPSPAHWVGLVPPLGSAVTRALSSPQSESAHQAESGFGPRVCTKSLVVWRGEKPAGGGWSSWLCPARSCARARAVQPRGCRSGCRPQAASLCLTSFYTQQITFLFAYDYKFLIAPD